MRSTTPRRAWVSAAIALVLAGSLSLSAAEPESNYPDRPENPDMSYRLGPVEYLEWLATDWPGRRPETFWRPVRGWIREEHLASLFALLDSSKPCAPVVDAHSSFIPPESTVGAEALMMIDGFRKGVYPPALHSRKYGAKDREEARRWWESRQKGAPAAN